MKLARRFELTPDQAAVAIGALRTVLEAGGPIDPREEELLAACAEALELGDGWQAIAAVDAPRAAQAFTTPGARLHLVHALIVAACIDGEVAAGSVAAVGRFAATLGVRTRWLAVLGHMSRRRVLPIKLAIYRSSPDARRMFARTWQEDGVVGMWRVLRFLLGTSHVDPALAWRFRQLGLLPEGTLGRVFWASLSAQRIGFPGEPGGLPERMIHHDLMHVVNGYGTDPAGECEVAGFYAAFTPGEPFTFVMIVLATFHLGLPVSPTFVRPTTGAFDPRRFLRAFARGLRLQVDVMGAWDYWALMGLPIAEVRVRLGIDEETRC